MVVVEVTLVVKLVGGEVVATVVVGKFVAGPQPEPVAFARRTLETEDQAGFLL